MGFPVTTAVFPVIYVRRFAGTAINYTVDNLFLGFSQGPVHVCADSNGKATFHQFESWQQ